MNCIAFDQRLDVGDLAALPSEVLAHAAACARCARALAAARALEAAFERHLTVVEVAAPKNLADAVMARVQVRRAQPRIALVADPTPWWVGIAAQPSVVGALVIAALLAWQGPRWLNAFQQQFGPGGPVLHFVAGPLARLAEWSRPLSEALVPASGGDWTTAVAIALCLSPLALVAGYALYRAAEQMFEGPVRA